jgi:hypothetical protein
LVGSVLVTGLGRRPMTCESTVTSGVPRKPMPPYSRCDNEKPRSRPTSGPHRVELLLAAGTGATRVALIVWARSAGSRSAALAAAVAAHEVWRALRSHPSVAQGLGARKRDEQR